MISRRAFVKNGVAAFTVGFAAPAFLSDLARAQGASSRNLVVLDLAGGNDGLSTLAPYTDSFYYSRRPTLALPAGQVLQVGTDSSGKALGLHPRLTGLRSIFNQGRLAVIQRVGYQNSSRSHFSGTDIWSTGNPPSTQGSGWIGRYLSTLGPLDPLAAWTTTGDTPHALLASGVGVAAIANIQGYVFSSPNQTVPGEAALERTTAAAIASHVPVSQPHLSFVATTVQDAMVTLDRVASVGTYRPSVTYPNNGFGQALQMVAGAMSKSIGTKVFFVQTGGFDTHASQDTTNPNGAYFRLMATLDDGLSAFYNDLRNTGLINNTLLLSFSEFGRRITENGSRGTDHGAASVMLALGGLVRGGIYGTAADLNPNGNPTLENSGGDVTFENDFRSAYAQVIDNWLGGNSVGILGGSFKKASLNFI
jgi:uncharacterized protein (DUF1501 family)